MRVYRISARCGAQPPAADWREQLVRRLGHRPRRLGLWAELGLYGALQCLDANAEATLPGGAALVLSSRHGPALAVQSAMAQARSGLPMPMTFLQTQPSQLLATLSAQLGWCGDARFITQPDPLALLALALAMADSQAADHADGLLLGWVDELAGERSETPSSLWLRLQPAADPGGAWCQLSDCSALQQASHVRLGASGVDALS